MVYAIHDPDERVSGSGRARARAAGIEVEVGDGAEESAGSSRRIIKHRRTGLPFVTVKYAASLDGRIAAALRRLALGERPRNAAVGPSQSPQARRDARRLVHGRHRQPAAHGAARGRGEPSVSRCASSSTAAAVSRRPQRPQRRLEDTHRDDGALEPELARQHRGDGRRGPRRCRRTLTAM